MRIGKIVICVFILLFGCLGAVGFYRVKDVEKTFQELDNNFYLKGNLNNTIEYDSEFIDEGFNATLDNQNLNNYVLTSSTLNTHEVGEYDIFYTLKYKKFNKTLQRHITVVDNENPTINVKCDNDIYVEINGDLNEIIIEAILNQT